VLQECREACGGQGFSAYNRIGLLRADYDIYTTADGDNRVLIQQITKSLLDDAQKNGNFDNIESLNKKFEQTIQKVKKNWLSSMRDLDILLEMFSFRQQNLLFRTWQLLFEKVGNGESQMQAWNGCANEIAATAISHIEYCLLVQFTQILKTEQAGPIKISSPLILKILTTLCELFALHKIEKDFGFFSSYFNLSKEYLFQLSSSIQSICFELRPHAFSLVESFKIPDKFISAPIAFDWIKAWSFNSL